MSKTLDDALALPVVRTEKVKLSPADALAVAGAHGTGGDDVARILLRERFGRVVYELFNRKNQPLAGVDASTGEVLQRITEAEAIAAAKSDFLPQAEVVSLDLLEGPAPMEFRGGVMPVYRVILDHPKNPHLYISPVTGRVLKRRNKPWRMFDFFWMLHIMDYRDREDFNHWLLTTMSVLAILTSASGLVIWGPRVVGFARRKG